ncbi:hypothetical protein OTU49_003134 [Cherax quadricarinatus]|uniref:Uncharacterized protein n=1 Tax=Cherax quadricarinatus TaxID=27406 RepID=A0AAW0X6Z5_CHEQU
MTEKGVTIERSPSGLGIGVFSPHLGGGGSAAWEQQQSTIITKLAQTPSNRIQTTENLDKERRTIRKVDEKNNVNELQMKIDKTSKKREDTSAKNVVTTSTDSTTTSNTTTITTTISDTIKAPLRLEAPPGSLTTTTKTPPESLLNGDIVVRRSLPGRTGRGDPRLVRSLDLELLEEEAHNTRRMLEEERAKNMYLTSLVEDLKRSSEREGGTTLPAISSGARSDQKPHELQQQRGRGRYFGRGRTRNRQQQQQQQPQQQQDRQQRQDISETEVGLHPSRGSGRAPTAREDSRGRRDPARTPTSSRDLSQGQRGGGHGRDGSVGATSSPQAEIKRGAAAQEQDPRPEIRAKGRGRAHRRGGRGRLRKEKHNASSEQPESEQ